jgi:PAS domain S-box-containing protein
MALAAEGARLALAFGNVLDENPEPFLEGFAAGAPELVLAGGVAADNLRFHGTFVIHGDQVYSRGLVLAAFYGQDLHVRTESLLNCTSVGRPMRITRAREECVYEIDGKPVLDVYRYYLGEEVLENIPVSMVEFPLIARTQGVDVARLPVSLTEDGALRYAGRLRMEEPVRFGIGDIFTMLERAREVAEHLACHVPAEALYVYSCRGRRLYLKEHAPIELGSLAAVAPAAGFFTYGEFFHLSGDNRLLNMTTTAVIVAESDEIHPKSPVLRQKLPAPNRTLRALAHLSEVTSQELAQSMRVLEQYRYALDQTAIVSRTDLQGRIMYVNALFEQVTGYRAEELMGNSHSLLRHPDTPSAVYESLWRTIRAKQIWRGVIKNRAKDGRAYYLKSTIIPLLDEHGEILEYISVAEDITEIIQAQERIERQTVDRLTGLPNRNSLIEVIERDRFGMLALLDVAGFKSINEYYGGTSKNPSTPASDKIPLS